MRRLTLALAVIASGSLAASSPAAAQVQPYGTNDYGGFRNVLPPGTNGFDNAIQLAQYESSGTRPPHNSDQLDMYANLTTAAPGITAAQIPQFFKDATFGVSAGNVGSTESPEPGVTIVRDSAYGVPHIYGDTRAALEFGIGYATAEDRLFFIDVLRHAGSATLASFAGGANVAMDESVWASEPYTQQDLQNQVAYGLTHSPYAQTVLSDATNYVAGINAYITAAKSNPLLMPAEYAAIGKLPEPFQLTDLISIATLVGGIFGKGGGNQLNNALLYEALRHRFGPERVSALGSPELVRHRRRTRHGRSHRRRRHAQAARAHGRRHRRRHRPRRFHADRSGFATFAAFAANNDPEAPTTVHGRRFRYQTLPRPSRAVQRTIALPDAGSTHFVNPVVGGTVPGAARGARSAPAGRGPIGLATGARANAGPGLLAFPGAMSNALLVSAAHSASGHPLAVMGPQVAYFAPQILMEQDIHGPGIDANGASFPGTNLYVELGHGTDYAWSATSAGQNIIDTFAVPLCNPSGGAVSVDSPDYMLNGHCVPMEILTRSESWQQNPLVDNTPSGSVTFQTDRTAFGLVVARARIHGRPVAYTNLRSTYLHEVDSIVGFYLFNDPAAMRNPQDFMHAASQIGYTFNWFYTDDRHIAYFNSGQNPVRAKHIDPLFPAWSSYTWPGYRPAAASTPSSLVEQDTPPSAHPQSIDQSYLTSWNNKQAPGYGGGATGQEFSSIHRSQLLDNNLNDVLRAHHGTLTLPDVVNAMGNAGTQDLRGIEVLPYALAVVGHPRDPSLARPLAALRAWLSSGAHRINRSHPSVSGSYEQSDAVRIMDAWWPLLIQAQFGPVLGTNLLDQIGSEFAFNDQPGHGTSGPHLGSAWDVGFYGIVQKDLRAVLGRRVRGPLNRLYCGRGSLRACRAALQSSLRQAAAESSAQVYPADGVCSAGDQMCSDSIQFRAIGAVKQPLIEWINRPTFQQADEIQGHGPR